jgi:GDP-L-fucose synthase
LKKKILIAGQDGMVGRSIYKLIKNKKIFNIIECNRKNLDFTNQKEVDKWFKKNKPEIVINAAGRVGGILDNSTYQSDYLYINTLIGLNLINASLNYNVKKLINLGSACIYPKNVKQPIKEDSLLSSQLEKSNEGYAIAKIVCLKYCQYLKQKHKKNFISIQPANLYGEGDNFNLKSSHVLPALVKKFTTAKVKKLKSVEIWGSGSAKREFLNVDDLANAVLFVLKNRIKEDYLNIGSGEQFSIREIAMMIKKITGYNGKIFFNKKYPDGVKRRQVDSSAIKKLGWRANLTMQKGLTKYCEYYIKEVMPLEK